MFVATALCDCVTFIITIFPGRLLNLLIVRLMAIFAFNLFSHLFFELFLHKAVLFDLRMCKFMASSISASLTSFISPSTIIIFS